MAKLLIIFLLALQGPLQQIPFGKDAEKFDYPTWGGTFHVSMWSGTAHFSFIGTSLEGSVVAPSCLVEDWTERNAAIHVENDTKDLTVKGPRFHDLYVICRGRVPKKAAQ